MKLERVSTIKVEARVSFADGFALALSERLQVPLITTDPHEFDSIEQKGRLRFL
jgi:predicted nucleic acid-binding protein